MYRMKNAFIAAIPIILVVLAGCATPCIGNKFTLPDEPIPDKATVYLYRPSEFLNSVHSIDIFDNDDKERIAEISNGAYIQFILPVGLHVIRPRWSHGDWGDWAEVQKRSVDLNAIGGKVYYVRLSQQTLSLPQIMYTEPKLELVTQDEALDEIRKCCGATPDSEE